MCPPDSVKVPEGPMGKEATERKYVCEWGRGARERKHSGLLKNMGVGFYTGTNSGKLQMSIGIFLKFILERIAVSPIMAKNSFIREITCFSETQRGQQEHCYCHLCHQNGPI